MKTLLAVICLACAALAQTTPHQFPEVGTSYVIVPGDTLSISVAAESPSRNRPDLTKTQRVRPDGMISMPLLNDVPAAGLTPMQLAASITEKLKHYTNYPHVTVIVTDLHGRMPNPSSVNNYRRRDAPLPWWPMQLMPDVQDGLDGIIFKG